MALIDFVPTDWNPGTAPGISADQLDRIEAGINDLDQGVWGGPIDLGANPISNVSQFLAVDGQSGGAPEYSFLGKPSWGMGTRLSNRLSFAVDGGGVFETGPDGAFFPDGTDAAPGVSFLGQNGMGMFRAGNTLGFSIIGVPVLTINSSSAQDIPNNPAVFDIPGVPIARATYTQAAFGPSTTTFFTRSSDILDSESIPHFRLTSADSATDPDRRIAVSDDFFGSAGGSDITAVLSGGWWNFQRVLSTVAIKTNVAVWNPAGTLPAAVTGPKTAGGPGVTPFAPYDLLAVTPVTYELEPDHIEAREVDPGEQLGYIAEDLAAVAPWLLNESGFAVNRDAALVAVVEILRDLNDRVVTLEP